MPIPNFLQSAAVELLTGLVVRANAGGDKTKEAARAGEIIAIVTALQQINSGATAAGLAALQTALQTTALDPSESLAIQNIFSFLATQIAALQSVGSATLLGQLQTAVLNNVAAAVIATCQAYLPTTTS
jgi:hypothetical protein